MAVYVFFQRFQRSKSNKNRLGQKFKIPVAYVFLCDHFAHVHPFWCKSDESPRTSSQKCVKMPHFDLLFDLCDLDLGHVTLSFAPGRSVTQNQYSLKVSRKSDNGKGVKSLWQTDRQTDKAIPISAQWQIKRKIWDKKLIRNFEGSKSPILIRNWGLIWKSFL